MIEQRSTRENPKDKPLQQWAPQKTENNARLTRRQRPQQPEFTWISSRTGKPMLSPAKHPQRMEPVQ